MNYGILENVSDEDYNLLQGLRATVLKQFARTPLHGYYAENHPTKSTPALVLGRALHTLVLQPKVFDQQYYVLTEKLDMRFKESKAILADIELKYAKDCILKLDDYERIKAMAGAVYGHKLARKLLESATAVESTLVWNEAGLLNKARLDGVNKSLRCVFDLKSCQDARLIPFSRDMSKYSYHLQAAHYFAGANEVKLGGEHEFEEFYFIAVESKAPYCCAVYLLNLETLMLAKTQREDLMIKYKQCKEQNKWPGLPEELQSIGLPAWDMSLIESEDHSDLE